MKLRKIVKHLDGFATIKLWSENEELLFEGSMLNVQVAAGKNKDKKIYLKECAIDECTNDIEEVLYVEQFLDYKLYSDINGEAIGVYTYKNAKGVTIPVFNIYIKK